MHLRTGELKVLSDAFHHAALYHQQLRKSKSRKAEDPIASGGTAKPFDAGLNSSTLRLSTGRLLDPVPSRHNRSSGTSRTLEEYKSPKSKESLWEWQE
jgi:hypothetical protein